MRRLVSRLFLVAVLAGASATPVVLRAMIPCTCEWWQECGGQCECSGQDGVIICSCTYCQ